jgi:hypothetical protein
VTTEKLVEVGENAPTTVLSIITLKDIVVLLVRHERKADWNDTVYVPGDKT